jgi:hypothetical protein
MEASKEIWLKVNADKTGYRPLMYFACTSPVTNIQRIIACAFRSTVQYCVLVRVPTVTQIIRVPFSLLDLYQCFHCILLLPLFYHFHTFVSFPALTEIPHHISHLKRWLIIGDLAWTLQRCGCGWVAARLVVRGRTQGSERLSKAVGFEQARLYDNKDANW